MLPGTQPRLLSPLRSELEGTQEILSSPLPSQTGKWAQRQEETLPRLHSTPVAGRTGTRTQPLEARSKNSRLCCPTALMHSECFHFHSFTVCSVRREVSPFTARDTEAWGQLVACPQSHSRPELRPLGYSGSPPILGPGRGLPTTCCQGPALQVLRGGLGRPLARTSGIRWVWGRLWAARSLVRGCLTGMCLCKVTATTPVASFFPLCSC